MWQMNKEDLQQAKLDIISWIVNESNETVLGQIQELIDDIEYERTSDTKVIGFGINGVKIFKSEFVRCIRQSERGLKNGEFLSVEDLEKQSETW